MLLYTLQFYELATIYILKSKNSEVCREVNYFITVDEFHALFIYVLFKYLYMCICMILLKDFNLFYICEYNTIHKMQIKLGKIIKNRI